MREQRIAVFASGYRDEHVITRRQQIVLSDRLGHPTRESSPKPGSRHA